MNMIKTSWCWWWGWSPEKVENWLEQMESKGWNLYQISFCAIRFKFKKGEPQKIRYCADFQTNADDQYFKLFTDDGWELAWNGAGGWYIWKKEYVNEKPYIYTDNESLIDRNKRLIKTLSVITAPLLVMFLVLIYCVIFSRSSGLLKILLGLYVGEFVFYGYVVFQLYRYNKKLIQNNN